MSLQKPDAAQIRAAISLLNWENSNLAKACGVTSQSISNIKRAVTRPQPRVLAAIKSVLEFNGIEFLDNSGVRFKPHSVETFEGPEDFRRFYNFIYEYLSAYGGDVCVNGVDEKFFIKYQGDFAEPHMNRMAELVAKRKDISMRILVREGDHNFVASSYAHYRWQSKKYFPISPFYVFGGNLALISFSHDTAPLVILIKSATFAESYRQLFDFAWAHAQEPITINKKQRG